MTYIAFYIYCKSSTLSSEDLEILNNIKSDPLVAKYFKDI